MNKWKAFCLILSLLIISTGWLGYSYVVFRSNLDEKISAQEWNAAENAISEWAKTPSCWLLKNIPAIHQKISLEKGWLMAQRKDYENAIKEFKKAGAVYNATTVALVEGKESLERLSEDYISALKKNPDDFQAKVNLEIIRILQQQAKTQMQAQGEGQGDKDGKKQKQMKKYQPGDGENKGTSSADDQGTRY